MFFLLYIINVSIRENSTFTSLRKEWQIKYNASTHLDLFRSRIRNQVKKQPSHRYLYLPDVEIFKNEERNITLAKRAGCML